MEKTKSRRESTGNAFVGVSLDTSLFSKHWVSFAMSAILNKHDSLLFLLADDLLLYTRSVRSGGEGPALDFTAAACLASTRSTEFRRFLETEISKLPSSSQERVRVGTWAEFSDSTYADLLRRLTIAFHTVETFRSSVVAVVKRHGTKVPPEKRFIGLQEASTSFILDEIAMCLRVTEKDVFPFEYYPASELPTVKELYAGMFAGAGLTVEALTGTPPRRSFAVLTAEV